MKKLIVVILIILNQSAHGEGLSKKAALAGGALALTQGYIFHISAADDKEDEASAIGNSLSTILYVAAAGFFARAGYLHLSEDTALQFIPSEKPTLRLTKRF